MELLKMFFKDEVPAVGLSRFKPRKEKTSEYVAPKLNFSKPIFKPNYGNNFFLL
jgi:hypothetical protein